MDDICHSGKMWVRSILVIFGLLACVYGKVAMKDSTKNDRGCMSNFKDDKGKESALEKHMVGGWKMMSLSDIQKSKELETLVSWFLTEENKISNSMVNYKLGRFGDNTPQIVKAFSQVVAGTNYCVEFMAKGDGCKNGKMLDTCKSDMACIVQIYNPLPIMIEGKLPLPEIKNKVCKKLPFDPK